MINYENTFKVKISCDEILKSIDFIKDNNNRNLQSGDVFFDTIDNQDIIPIDNPKKELLLDYFYSNFNILGIIERETEYKKLMPINFDESIKIFIDGTDIINLNKDKIKSDIIEYVLNGEEPKGFKIEIEKVENQDWSKIWKSYWKPFRISDNFIICPSWEEYNKTNDNDIVITIDPSNAFGTGTHATTALCAKKIIEYKRKEAKYIDNNNLSLCDLGTGSGILAIIAKKLSFKDILAIDIDESTFNTAKENFKLNNCNDIILQTGTAIDIKDKQFDFVIANILHNIIINELHIYKNLMKPDGILILSGILDEKKQQVLDEIKKQNLTLIDEETKDSWVVLIVKK